jgi:spoIIIJ-associated protein
MSDNDERRSAEAALEAQASDIQTPESGALPEDSEAESQAEHEAEEAEAEAFAESEARAPEESSAPSEARAKGGKSSNGEGRRRSRRRERGDAAYDGADDERARQALGFVSDVLREMDMDCSVRLRRPAEGSEGEVNIEVGGRDAGRIIGKKGQVLQALQFLTHRVINRPGLERRHVMVDAEGYRSRRDNSLASMARRLGRQAVDEGQIITFEPMNPRDRRVVHLALAKFEGVITKSDGEGDERRVQIIPVRR